MTATNTVKPTKSAPPHNAHPTRREWVPGSTPRRHKPAGCLLGRDLDGFETSSFEVLAHLVLVM